LHFIAFLVRFIALKKKGDCENRSNDDIQGAMIWMVVVVVCGK